MSNKTEQLNLRISSNLKSDLMRISEEEGMSMSDFIRQILEDAITSHETVEERVTTLEQRLLSNWQKTEKRLLYAGATIANIDTKLPLDQCLTRTAQIMNNESASIQNLMQLSRHEMEEQYLKIQQNIKQDLNLSDIAIAFISIMFTTFNGIRFDEHIFDMSPLSVITLERIRTEIDRLSINQE